MDNFAVAPTENLTVNIFGMLKKEQEKTFETLKEDDQLWKDFYNSSFFDLVDKYVDNLCESLDDLEGKAFETGASNEEIVMRRAVARLTKVNLKSLITKIEQTGKQK